MAKLQAMQWDGEKLSPLDESVLKRTAADDVADAHRLGYDQAVRERQPGQAELQAAYRRAFNEAIELAQAACQGHDMLEPEGMGAFWRGGREIYDILATKLMDEDAPFESD